MATQAVLISMGVIDADGDRATIPIYGTFDDATATLGSLAAWAAARVSQLDPVLDVQVVSMGITIYPTLPGGIKLTPNAGSDVEKTGLFTFGLFGLAASKSHSIDVPGFLPSKFVGDNVNTSDAAVQAFYNGYLAPYGTVIPTETTFSSPLSTFRKAVKSFRKLGKRP